MSRVIGVRIQRSAEIIYLDPGDLVINVKDEVLIDSNGSLVTAEVVIGPDQLLYSELRNPLKNLIKKVYAKNKDIDLE